MKRCVLQFINSRYEVAFSQCKIDQINCFGYNDDYSRGKRLEKVEGVVGDRRMSGIRKGNNMFNSRAIHAFMNALETMALTEKQQEKAQICEKQPDKNNHGS